MTRYPTPLEQQYGADLAALRQKVALLQSQVAQLTAGAVACTSATHPTNPAVGMQIFETDTGYTLIWDGSAWRVVQSGAWTTGFVPAWTQSGASPAFGDATVTTGYEHAGRTVCCRFQFVFGSTTNFGSGNNPWNFSVPVPAVVPSSGFWNVGSWSALCAGAFYTGAVRLESSGVSGLFANNSTLSVGTSNPGTWGSGNYLEMSFTYESTS